MDDQIQIIQNPEQTYKLHWANRHPYISHKRSCGGVASHLRASGYLKINELLSRIHLVYEFAKKRVKFLFGQGYINTQLLGAGVKSVKMLVEGVRLMISCVDDFKNTVAEIAGAIVHRNGHVFNKVVFSVIVT